MSFKNDIQEKAVSIAKKFDHGQLLPEHVLLAVLQSQAVSHESGTQESVLIAQVTDRIERLKNIPHTTGQIELTAEAEAVLNRCSTRDQALECERDLVKQYFDVEIQLGTEHLAPSSHPQEHAEDSTMTLDSALAELDSLVGLEQVKTDVRKLIAVHQANIVRVDSGLTPVPQSLHIVFAGSPGTGKTTVARCIANIYGSIGLLPNNGLVEVGRADLVAGYVGQTALKVQEVVKSALGGVLFIDEAYSLSNDNSHGYGTEAISELVKSMENHRHELAVIAAGYKEDMSLFVSSNPGLKSRFQNFVNFPDYSAKELIQIFTNLATSNQVNLSPELQEHLTSYLEKNLPKGENGNARFIRNLFESMFKNMATRAAADGKIELHELSELQVADLPALESIGSTPALGFH